MAPDFYLDQRTLAAYFEKEWFDHVLAQHSLPPEFFEFAPFDPAFLYSDSHEQTADFLHRTLSGIGVAPVRLLEVGSALGRGFYEICRRTPSLRSAALIEPSQNLADTFDCLFRRDDRRSYPVLKGNTDLAEVAFDSTHLQEVVRGVEITLVNCPHERLGADLGFFDLVACFNVLDNCQAPLALVELLKRHTSRAGIVALSSTHQWSREISRHADRARRPGHQAGGRAADPGRQRAVRRGLDAPERHQHRIQGSEV